MNAANDKQAWCIHERCKVCLYAPEQDVEPIVKLHHQCINNTERLPHKPNDSARLGCRLGWILVLLNTVSARSWAAHRYHSRKKSVAANVTLGNGS